MDIRSKVRAGAFVLAAMAALLPLAITPSAEAVTSSAEAGTGDDIVEACRSLAEVPELTDRVCGGLERGLWLGAQHCRRVDGLDEDRCPVMDGRSVHEAAMVTAEQSWTARALDLQADLDRHVPLTDALILHTHNSANSAAYAPSVTSNDANQILTITDQLRLGIRGIELDVHWAPHPSGEPAHGFRAPVQCHGQAVATPAGAIHAGCSYDQLLVDLLRELRAWLDRPEHADEMVLLYLENVLDGDEAAHRAAVDAIEQTIGDLVLRPAAAGCQDLPVHRSKGAIVDAGARVLVTGNCGPGGWNDLVFQRGPAWNESGSTTTYLAGSDCDAERAANDYANRFIRRWEDSTFLSLMAGAGSHITPDVAASLVRCGVNMPGLDQLEPVDERLAAFVWSWRDQEPTDDPTRACAVQGTDSRFGAAACARKLPVACRTADGAWAVTQRASSWKHRQHACVREGHAGAGVPANGWDNVLLRRAAEGAAGDVWLGYGRDESGRWARDPDSTVAWP